MLNTYQPQSQQGFGISSGSGLLGSTQGPRVIPPPELPSAIEELNKITHELRERVVVLIDRLSPILACPPPTEAGCNVSCPAPTPVQISSQIRDVISHQRIILAVVNDALGRLHL